MTRVLGLDLSLSATGVADETGTRVIKGPKPEPFVANRLDYIETELFNNLVPKSQVLSAEKFARDPFPDVAIIEGFGYMKGAAQFVLELHGVVKLALYRLGIPFALVPPALVKKFATGHGNADKDHVLAAAIRKFDFQGSDNNEADAWILYWMGVMHYDPAAEPLFDYQREALARVEWPTL